MNKLVLTAVALCASMPLFGQFSQRTPVPNFTYIPTTCAAAPFTDVPAASGFCRWIKKLSEDGITQGCGGGAFCPQNPVTREQMAVFLELAMRGTTTWSPWQGVFKRTILVNADKNLTDLQAGTALMDAMASITDSATYSYLLKLEPRVYDLGAQTLTIADNVDLEGSGRDVTTITATGASITTVVARQSNTIRGLTIKAAGTTASIAINVGNETSVEIDSCNIESDTPSSSIGIYSAGSFTLRNSKITAFGEGITRGIKTVDGEITLINSDVSAPAQGTASSIAIEATGARGTITGSTVEATGTGGSSSAAAATFSEGYWSIQDSRFTSSAAGSVVGIRISSSAFLSMHDTEVGAIESTISAAGVEAIGSTTMSLRDVTITSQSSGSSNGVTTSGSSSILGSRIVSIGSTASSGIWVSTGATTIESSHVFGSTEAIYVSGTVQVGGTGFSGGANKNGAGLATCVASWNALFAPLPATCI